MNNGAGARKLTSPISEETMTNDEGLADFDLLKNVLTQEIKPYLQEHSPLLKRQNKPDKLVCAISYAWGDKDHEAWVEAFAEVLEAAGIDVLLDRWDDRSGKELMSFVEKMFDSHYLLVIGTPLYLTKYKKRFNSSDEASTLTFFSQAASKEQEHVVRTEMRLMRYIYNHSESLSDQVIPILLEGTLATAFPYVLRTKLARDMTQGNVLAETLTLLRDIYRIDNRDKQFQRFMQRFEVKPSRTSANATASITDTIPIVLLAGANNNLSNDKSSLIAHYAKHNKIHQPKRHLKNYCEGNQVTIFFKENGLSDFDKVNLDHQDLSYCDFSQVSFWQASFRCAILKETNLKKADISGANISWVKNLSVKQLSKAQFDQLEIDERDEKTNTLVNDALYCKRGKEKIRNLKMQIEELNETKNALEQENSCKLM